ncbi:MAG: tRNA 4-thiouridine(8) synthase ThiI [Bdellovibrionales bacterium]|nr:tRNA 4-thiouridine(8) synthase ThiI [Bdellovibrionales bacterium]
MQSHLVISVDELWLKGKNRKSYLKAATDHISAVFKNYHAGNFTYKIQAGRLYYLSKTEFTLELITALRRVPGLSYISRCIMLERMPENNLSNAFDIVLKEMEIYTDKNISFRPIVRRVDKTFPETSVFVAREIGHLVLEKFPLAKVNLDQADVTIDFRILLKHIAVTTKTYKGLGGLPWGTTGSAMTLLSGGFDSPVASFLMSKRGIKQSFVFFHAYPFVGREVLKKIKNLTSVLAGYQRQTHLYVVPFGDLQNLISQKSKEEYRTIIFRKLMIEIANLLCDQTRVESLITGDCIGQVSSQTMANMYLMDKASRRMILRPLVGYNKMEILSLAATIGTHDISKLPHDDACALFASKTPVINPNLEYWNSWDKEHDFSEELKKALENTETYSVNMKGELFKKDFLSFDM